MILESQLNPRSADFQANAAAMRAVVEDLRAQIERVSQGGGEAARAKHVARGKLLPRERVEMLLDPGTPFLEIAPLAALNMYGNDAPGAGLIAGIGSVAGIAQGTALAALALTLLGGDLGGGYFTGAQPALQWSTPAALLYGLLGVAAALIGGWWPARHAQHLPPAQTLKGLGAQAGRGARACSS